jgi:FkbM family methyltransferase
MLDELLITAGRYVGKPRGWERVVRWFAPPGNYVTAKSRVVTTAEGMKFLAEPTSLIGWYALFFGEYEPEAQKVMASLLKPGQTAIDVGANVGWHTLLLANCVGPTGRVVAFEPNPNIRPRLEANLARNHLSNVSVSSIALSDRSGTMRFRSPKASDMGAGDGHLINAATYDAAIDDATTNDGEADDVIEVTTQRLDDLWPSLGLNRVDLIKIDVEGWDASVLGGARETLRRFQPHVLFEFDSGLMSRAGGSETKLRALLEDVGYAGVAITREGLQSQATAWPEGQMILASPKRL